MKDISGSAAGQRAPVPAKGPRGGRRTGSGAFRRAAAVICLLALPLSGCGGDGGASAMSQSAADTAAPGGAYTFVWMSDTQYYSASYPEIFSSMTEWIAGNEAEQNIKAVFHTGDLTDDGADSAQWENAVSAMSTLSGVVPYTVLAGNKDVSIGGSDSDYSAFLKYFGACGGGSVLRDGSGEAMALLLEAGATKYVVLALGWNADDGALSWANGVLAEYPDRVAIVTTHDYLDKKAELSENGERIYREIVEPNANVRLVLCGHKYCAARRTTEIDDDGDGAADRTVYQLIADYQNGENGGDGFMRLLTVDEAAKTLTVRTYSPYMDKYDCFSADEDEFTLSIADWWS